MLIPDTAYMEAQHTLASLSYLKGPFKALYTWK